MPTEQGVLTLRGNVYTAYTCEEESFKVAEATDLSIRMEQTLVDASKIPAGQLLNVMIWPMMTQWMDALAGYMSFFAFSYLFL
jgi:hypothetical protein